MIQRLKQYLSRFNVSIRIVDEETEDTVVVSGTDADSVALEKPETEYDIESLRRTHEEGRATLDHLISTINDTDDKAAYTLRINILILGIVATIISLTLREGIVQAQDVSNVALYVAIASSILSLVVSLLIYSRTEFKVGLSANDLGSVLGEKFSEERLLLALIRSEQRWIRYNEKTNKWDADRLFLAQFLLLFSIVSYLVAGYILVQGWDLSIPML